MGSSVRVVPLSRADLRAAWMLLERLTWELDEERLKALAGLGLERRRLWLTQEPTGAWLYERIDGDATLISLGPEAVWAVGATSIDAWLGDRSAVSSPAETDVLPTTSPALDIRFRHDALRGPHAERGVEILLRPTDDEARQPA